MTKERSPSAGSAGRLSGAEPVYPGELTRAGSLLLSRYSCGAADQGIRKLHGDSGTSGTGRLAGPDGT